MKTLSITLLILLLVKEAMAQVKIKAEQFFPFQEGLAVVKYQNSYAVINSSGTFVVPYNKYYYQDFGLGSLEPEKHGFVNGACVVQDVKSGLFGLINQKGVLIIPAAYTLAYPFDTEGWARVFDAAKKSYFVNKSGTKIPVPSCFYDQRDTRFSTKKGGLEDLFIGGPSRDIALGGKEYFGDFSAGISPGKVEDGKYSFFTRAGKQIFDKKFTSVEPFSDGLACVSTLNEFEEKKYGFVDKSGKLVIPCIFSVKPGNFKNGLAYVEPANKNGFDFAFINKNGEVTLKQNNIKPLLMSNETPEFKSGYFLMISKESYQPNLRVIDSTGNDSKYLNSIRKVNAVITNASYSLLSNHILTFNYKEDANARRSMGFLNIQTGQIVYTRFSTISAFDTVSGLAVANDSGGGQVYINQAGSAVIGISSRSDW